MKIRSFGSNWDVEFSNLELATLLATGGHYTLEQAIEKIKELRKPPAAQQRTSEEK